MSETAEDESTIAAPRQATFDRGPDLEFQQVVREIVDLCYPRTLSVESIKTSSEMCSAFLDIILRNYNLSSAAIYLRDDDAEVIQTAFYSERRLDSRNIQALAASMASLVMQHGAEIQIGMRGESAPLSRDEEHLKEALTDAGVSSGIALPIEAQGALRGVIIALSAEAERLSSAVNAIRFLAAPIIVAVGRARQSEAMRQQHAHIEGLVEELRQHSFALEEANRELRHVALYRSLFLARMSHELRTPLTAILGFAEILLDQEKMSEPQRSFCQRIQSSGLQLQSSLNQLLDLSRLEAGQSELFLHEFSFWETLRESCAAVASLAHKENVNVEYSWAPGLNSIVSDEGKLRQVLYNFLINSINRSPSGGIVIVRADSIENSRCRITIEDYGIPPSDLSRVFEPFETDSLADKSAAMSRLGLAIAKRLIDVLGGTVRLESSEDVGLRVFLELPALPRDN